MSSGLVKRNRSAAGNIRHVNGSVLRRNLDVAMQAGAIVHRIHRERWAKSDTAVLAYGRPRIGHTLRSVIHSIRIRSDRSKTAAVKNSAAKGLVINVRRKA